MPAARRRLTVPDRLPPYYSLAIAAFVVALDYAVGPHLEFPGLFIVPVMYGAWYGGARWGLPLSLLPFAHVANVWALGAPDGLFPATLSTIFRVAVLMPVAWWIATVAASQRALRKEVDMLEGLLPICSYCKKIRDDTGDWQALEKYIQERSDATFTHGICDACLKEQLVEWKRSG
ncbi:MAG TPA: hypothetical protein VFZ36_10925 [Vicinamibacterales bacterium]